jgi:hypothetical protein
MKKIILLFLITGTLNAFDLEASYKQVVDGDPEELWNSVFDFETYSEMEIYTGNLYEVYLNAQTKSEGDLKAYVFFSIVPSVCGLIYSGFDESSLGVFIEDIYEIQSVLNFFPNKNKEAENLLNYFFQNVVAIRSGDLGRDF